MMIPIAVVHGRRWCGYGVVDSEKRGTVIPEAVSMLARCCSCMLANSGTFLSFHADGVSDEAASTLPP